MSAGTGVYHSEYNKNSNEFINLLQLWITPNKRNVNPRYDQLSIKELKKKNSFYQVLSPYPEDDGVWINQDAWFHLGDFEELTSIDYVLKQKGNGVYVFIIKGVFKVANENLRKRDALGIWNTNKISFEAQSKSQVLLVEVPMKI